MYNNKTSILFMATLVVGTLVTLSSNTWMGVWMGLEINMMAFMPMLSNKNYYANETSIKYFMVQSLASMMLLFSIMMIQMKNMMNWDDNIKMLLISSSLFMKIGSAPFQFWLPEVMGMTSWMNCILLMTWQKIAPMAMLSYCMKMNMINLLAVILSVTIGAIGGMNQMSLRHLMAYSSISHIGWMMSAMMIMETMWELYFIMYAIMSITMAMAFDMNKFYSMNQLFNFNNANKFNKMMMMMAMLSMGGMPPFMGFMPKWMVVQYMIDYKMTFTTTIMIMMNTIVVYYYLRVTFTAMNILLTESKWMTTSMKKSKVMKSSYLIMLSNMGLTVLSSMNFLV
uniref:NADH dehydrogenase subunit 2 n=1 Tax=China mantispoides TaxID=3034372 RepID=UPI0024113BA4|nr:NADH dehydrogenase subunit 2 [China mantispoides]WEL32769.1 NADH dehydrogenase subunit 2 [China mantispoides]